MIIMSSFMHPWYLSCAYACNRCARRSDPTGIRGNGSGGSATPAIGATGASEEVLEDVEVVYPDHTPCNFMKGKPRSIISLLISEIQLSIYVICIDALSYRCWLKTLDAYISYPCLENLPWILFRFRIEYMLSPALTGRSQVISCHLRALGIYMAWLAIFCYRGKEPWINSKKTGWKLTGAIMLIVPPSVLVKD
jgi:hypothetical protein